MPDDPPKAGGGVERAPADVGADSISLSVGCEERHDDGMRGDDLFACRGSIAGNLARARPVAASTMVRGATLSGVLAASIASA